jgi:hypothetical protein
MDTHTESAVAEAPAETQAELPLADTAINELPQDQDANLSFNDALESALSKLSGADQTETPTEEVAEPQEEQPEFQPETQDTEETPLVDKQEEETSEPEEKAETETTETSDDPLDNLTEEIEDWTPKAANRFKELKGELKSSQSELESLRQTVAEQQSKIDEMSGLVENRDIDKLQETLTNYEYEKAFDNLEETVAYKQSITEPLNALMDRASQIGDHYDVDSDTVIDILSLDDAAEQDAAIQQYFPGASDRDKAALYRVIDEIDPILEKRQNLYENVEQALNEANLLEEQRINSEKAAEAKHRAEVTKNVVARVGEKLPFLGGVEGLDMSAVQQKVSEIDPSLVHPVDFAYNAVAAQLLPVIVKQYISSRKDVDGLMDKLASYEDAEPTMSGTPSSDSTSPSRDLSFEEAISAALSG